MARKGKTTLLSVIYEKLMVTQASLWQKPIWKGAGKLGGGGGGPITLSLSCVRHAYSVLLDAFCFWSCYAGM